MDSRRMRDRVAWTRTSTPVAGACTPFEDDSRSPGMQDPGPRGYGATGKRRISGGDMLDIFGTAGGVPVVAQCAEAFRHKIGLRPDLAAWLPASSPCLVPRSSAGRDPLRDRCVVMAHRVPRVPVIGGATYRLSALAVSVGRSWLMAVGLRLSASRMPGGPTDRRSEFRR